MDDHDSVLKLTVTTTGRFTLPEISQHCRNAFGEEFVDLDDVRYQGSTLEIDLLMRIADGDEALQRESWIGRISELIERTFGVRVGFTVTVG